MAKILNTLLNTGLGLALQGHNDRRQIEQQKKLGQQQLGLDIQKMSAQKAMDLQMWKDTNYKAQKEEMEKAGLNPALLYGTSGGGGTTVGNSGGSVSSGQAPQGGGEIMGIMMQKAQLDLMKAQVEATKADANLKNVDAGKKGGIDTELGKAQVESLLQGVSNQKATEELTKIQSRLNNLELNLKEDSYGDALDNIRYTAQKIEEEFRNIRYERILSGETLATKIATAEAELINKGLEGELLKRNSELGAARIKEISASISQKWKALSIEDRNAMTNYLNAKTNEYNADTNRKNHYEGVRQGDLGHYDKRGELKFKEWLNDIPESERQVMETVKGVLQAAAIGGAIKGGNRNPIGFKKY